MTNSLTDAQIWLLQSGLRRTDRGVVSPIGKGGAAKKLASSMIDAGWLKEVRAKLEAPIWRSDRTTGLDFSLNPTAAGFIAISATEIDPNQGEPGDLETDNRTETKQSKSNVHEANCVQPFFREGSKLATAVTLLRRSGCATTEQLSVVLNRLPDSTRAMLTGLRKRGVVVTRRKAPGEHASAYGIETDALEAPGRRLNRIAALEAVGERRVVARTARAGSTAIAMAASFTRIDRESRGICCDRPNITSTSAQRF